MVIAAQLEGGKGFRENDPQTAGTPFTRHAAVEAGREKSSPMTR